MVNISDRLRDERSRLKLKQDTFAELAGVSKRALANYEAGERSPDAEFLLAIAQAGADVPYILTGQRTSADFTPAEIDLVHAYRNASPAGRAAVMSVLSAIAPNTPTSPRQVFNAPVGQVIENNKGSARSRIGKNERTKTDDDTHTP